AFKENGAVLDKDGQISRIVRPPGDSAVRGWTPSSPGFPDQVVEWLESKFLLPDSGRELQRLMRAVAPLGEWRVLARQGIPQRVDEAEGVLQLDWEKFQHLSQSIFTVVCQARDRSLVELLSEGQKKPGEYELAGRKGMGIALKHKQWNHVAIDP